MRWILRLQEIDLEIVLAMNVDGLTREPLLGERPCAISQNFRLGVANVFTKKAPLPIPQPDTLVRKSHTSSQLVIMS